MQFYTKLLQLNELSIFEEQHVAFLFDYCFSQKLHPVYVKKKKKKGCLSLLTVSLSLAQNCKDEDQQQVPP